MSCIATVANTATAIGFLCYVLVREGQNELPDYYMYWHDKMFTREFWVCQAFPTIFANADELYGFRACEAAVSQGCLDL
jgi:hypothetical protein